MLREKKTVEEKEKLFLNILPEMSGKKFKGNFFLCLSVVVMGSMG